MGYDFVSSATPIIDDALCTNCSHCARICPTGTLQAVEGRIHVTEGTFMGCIGCGHCMMVCPSGGIRVHGRRIAPEDLVELPPERERATADQLDAILLSRRSIRTFEQREIDRALVERIVQMTATAPVGIPPSEVGIVVLHSRSQVRGFVEDMMAAFEQTGRFFRPLVLAIMRPFWGRTQHRTIRDFVKPLMDLLVERWKRGHDAFCYDAPLAMIFHRGPMGDSADSHIAATYAMIAAQSLGLGSCWLGTVVVLNHFKELKTKYHVPKENEVTGMLVIGYAAVNLRRSLRRQLASVEYL